ncbi:MAG: D-glycero-beta-D-manno-heptose-7-phosphate kinase [Candidatus Omnitrophica bacterium]|nr:D-glycero-beta-D-manno-heptose-7-phosphate kinase [Candidatus Omnitrophota bacterium]
MPSVVHENQYVEKSKRADCTRLVKRFPQCRILVIGDFILDEFIWGDVDRISPEAPVPVVNVRAQSFMPGGSLNVANNIKSLGGLVYPCGVLGRDIHGRMLLMAMRKQGIDTGGVIYDKTRPTTLKTRIIAHSQQVVRYDRESLLSLGKKDCDKIIDFVAKKIKDVDVILIEDYGKGVITEELLKQIIRIARREKKRIVVDPKEKHFSYYSGVTAITPNHHEAYGAVRNGELGGTLSLEEVGQKLLSQLECQSVLITLGKDGMALFEKNGDITRINTAAREVYDVAGAGDTVISVFALALAAGASMKEAAKISNLAAGIVVGKVGVAVCTPEELVAAFDSSRGQRSS